MDLGEIRKLIKTALPEWEVEAISRDDLCVVCEREQGECMCGKGNCPCNEYTYQEVIIRRKVLVKR